MAAAIQFDTLDYAKRLAKAGVPIEQAEAQAEILGEALTRSIAFPADLVALENAFTARMTTMESRLDAKFEALESRLEAMESRLDAKIEAVESRLDAKIEAVESRLDTKFEALKSELKLDLGGKIERVSATVDNLKWMFGLVAALNIGILLKLMLSH